MEQIISFCKQNWRVYTMWNIIFFCTPRRLHVVGCTAALLLHEILMGLNCIVVLIGFTRVRYDALYYCAEETQTAIQGGFQFTVTETYLRVSS